MSAPAAVSRRTLGAVFLTIFLDLVGFSLVFPLGPALLEFYLGQESSAGPLGAAVGWLGQLVGAESGPGGAPPFAVTALFGGLLGALFSILQFLSAPIWGRWSDRVGRRPVLLMTVGGTAIAYGMWIFADSFWLFLVSRILAGAMAGNLSVATAAIADATPPERRARGMALVGVAFGLGFVMGPAIGGYSALINPLLIWPGLADWGIHPFSVPALLGTGLGVLNLLWVWKGLPETWTAERRAAQPDAVAERPGLRLIARTKEPAVRLTNLIYFLFILAFAGMEFSVTFLAAERLGYGPAQNAQLFVFLGVVLLLVQGGFVRRYAHRIGERKLARLGLAAAFAAYAGLSLAQSAPLFYLGLAFLGVAAGLANPTFSALVSLYSPEHRQGANLGAYRAAGSLGRVGGPLLGGIFYWWLGSATLYLIAAVWTILPLMLALKLPPPHPPNAP